MPPLRRRLRKLYTVQSRQTFHARKPLPSLETLDLSFTPPIPHFALRRLYSSSRPCNDGNPNQIQPPPSISLSMALLEALATIGFFIITFLVSFATGAAAALLLIALAKAARGLLPSWCRKQHCGLGPAEIEAIPVYVHAAGEGRREGECAVCLEEFVEGEALRRLGCGHCYHGECIREWLGQKPTCPKCLSEVRVEVERGMRLLLPCCCH